MAAAGARSALIVSCCDDRDGRTAQRQPAAQQVLELARLLGDPAVGRFEVTTLLAPTAAALHRELARFLADRAPQDTVVVHLAGRVVAADDGEHHLCDPEVDRGASGAEADGLAVTTLEEELRRCRSQRIVLLLDCPADEPATSLRHGGAQPVPVLHERLRAPGRSVHAASTEAVVDLLQRGTDGDTVDPSGALRALLVDPVDVTVAVGPTPWLLAALATVVSTAMFGVSIVLIGSSGPVGIAVAVAAVVVVLAPIFRRATREGWGLPPDDTVLGDGVPFYCLYMLRRSQKSRDYFRHH